MMLTPSITRTRGALMRMQSILTKRIWLMKMKTPSSTCAASRMEPDWAAAIVSHTCARGRDVWGCVQPGCTGPPRGHMRLQPLCIMGGALLRAVVCHAKAEQNYLRACSYLLAYSLSPAGWLAGLLTAYRVEA